MLTESNAGASRGRQRPGAVFRGPSRSSWASTGLRLKLKNVLDRLPKRLQPRVKAALHEVMYAETREQARDAVARFSPRFFEA